MTAMLPPSRWALDPSGLPAGEELVGIGADLEPATVLGAYASGVFPMPLGRGRRAALGWWSPDPRGVLPLDRLRVPRSLRASCRRFEVRVDTAFPDVLDGCASPHRPGGWISPAIRRAYVELHRLGYAHSVEAWTPSGRLIGGLYGVAIGGLFAGESMFHRERDASKVALVALVDLLMAAGSAEDRLLDVQWSTEHLATLGVCEVPREEYLHRLTTALSLPLPPAFG